MKCNMQMVNPILFRLSAPDRMPHARLMAVVQALHEAGYERLYLHSCPRPSGMHWRWHLFTGTRNWFQRPWREGWYGSGSDYIFNPVIGWGDNPGAGTAELIRCLAQYDPEGLARALGKDEEHTVWFKKVCAAFITGLHVQPGTQWPQSAGTRALAHLPGTPEHAGLFWP